MNGRRKAGKWSRWLQIVTVSLFLVFVIFIIYGISRMIGEVRTITIGQQELITRLALKSHKSEVPEEKKLAVEYISKKDFKKGFIQLLKDSKIETTGVGINTSKILSHVKGFVLIPSQKRINGKQVHGYMVTRNSTYLLDLLDIET